ncbi:MAG: hypothetical protein II881_06990 [Oscillospiraceae bacterium]|nr:hypothetical protein [Oscillospiraceae bacterium]
MTRYDLNEAIGMVDDKHLSRAERVKKRRRWPYYSGAVAAMLAVVIFASVVLGSSPSAFAVSEAVYPKMAKINSSDYVKDLRTQLEYRGRGENLSDFYADIITEVLSDTQGENTVFSPLSIYMGLSMLAETTNGTTRRQILDALNAESIEALRAQAHDIWNANYRDTGAVTSALATSLWLSDDVYYKEDTIKTISDNYYASVYRGDMTSESYNAAYRRWLDEQTGGMLKDAISGKSFVPDCVMSLLSTVYFKAKWAAEFNKENTKPDTFHAPDGDVTVDFMHRTVNSGSYYWGEKFSAISLGIKEGASRMLLIMPDEGYTPDDLLTDSEALSFISTGMTENVKALRIIMSIPKFDVIATIDMEESLRNLGITEAFDMWGADFSGAFDAKEPVFLKKAEQGARLVLDEEGVKAAAYFDLGPANSAAPPEEQIVFTLDRPFIFVLYGEDVQPLFAGVINKP